MTERYKNRLWSTTSKRQCLVERPSCERTFGSQKLMEMV